MALKECRMVLVFLTTQESMLPIAEVITTALTKEEAEEHARQELKRYIKHKPSRLLHTKDLGKILYSPFPTTIFLYTQDAGRLK